MNIFQEKNIKPMLTNEMRTPFNSKDYIYELKLYGIRCIAYLDEKETDLRNRKNLRLLPKFPELRDIHLGVKARCILDGEIVIVKNGVSDLYELQQRILTDSGLPASFVAYDIIYINNKDVTNLPLSERKGLLENIVEENISISTSRFIEEKGVDLYHLANLQRLDGVIAKRKDSKYFFDRKSNDWVTFKRTADEYYIICGFILKGERKNYVILGQYKDNLLVYKGCFNFGITLNIYDFKILPASPFYLTPLFPEEIIWVEPTLVCAIEYVSNSNYSLRKPVFKGIKEDINPRSVIIT